MRSGEVHRPATARRTLWLSVFLLVLSVLCSGTVGAASPVASFGNDHAPSTLSRPAAAPSANAPLPAGTAAGTGAASARASDGPGPFGAPQRPGSDFTTYLGNVERTSNISGEVLLNLTTLPKLQQLWRFVTNLTAIANKSAANPSGSGGIQSQTLEVNGTAYFGIPGRI